MATLRIRVDPHFLCGVVSWGTVEPIKILRAALDLRLAEAKEYVDRAVFGGEVVDIEVRTLELARDLAIRLPAATGSPAVLRAEVVDDFAPQNE